MKLKKYELNFEDFFYCCSSLTGCTDNCSKENCPPVRVRVRVRVGVRVGEQFSSGAIFLEHFNG